MCFFHNFHFPEMKIFFSGPSPGGTRSGHCGGGAGHGGYGGGSNNGAFGGKPYGSTFMPLVLGSKGGNGGSQGKFLIIPL